MYKPIYKPTLILLFFVASWSMAAEPGNLRASIEDYYASHLEELFIWFHRNPELSFLEHQTAKRLASELRQLGVEVTEGVGGTGIVGVINNGWLASTGRQWTVLCVRGKTTQSRG